MKALEILNKYKSEQKFLLNCMKQSLPHRDIKIINNDIQLCDEAIEELEEFNNRCCGSCNYYTGTVCYCHEGWCDEIGVVHPTMENNDCCNRYEKKDSE